MCTPPSYAITGIKEGWGPDPKQVPLRVEVDDFFTQDQYSIQRNLFILAMVKFQAIPYGETLSYFQVAGIHGLPHVPWDAWPAGGYHPQYCEHGTILFGTWHRPYMTLFEQRLYELMLSDVIPDYDSDTQRTLKAEAAKFRFPYWDWAAKKPRSNPEGTLDIVWIYDLPLIVQQEEVSVTRPDGSTGSIPNPLYCFKVAGKKPMGEYGITPVQISNPKDPYNATPSDRTFATSRCPPNPNSTDINMNAYINGVQNNREAGDNLRKSDWYQKGGCAYTVGEAVYRLFSPGYFSTYKAFVTTAYEPKVTNRRDYMSLEAVHNNIHNWVGGTYGHMTEVPIAAFDPIFWLHHGNIDRLLAIWQALYPDQWWDQDKDNKLPTTPLEPFHSNTARNTYTSNAVRDHVPLGYTYPELQRWKYANDKDYITSIRAALHKLYGQDAATAAVTAHGDYIVNVKYERFALQGDPFTVLILLNGQVIGNIYNFSARFYNEGHPGCENCHQQQLDNKEVTGQVAITHALRTHFLDKNDALTAFDVESVSKHLKDNLTWKIVRPSRQEVPLEQVPSLTVSVAAGRRSVFKVPDDAPQTQIGQFKLLHGGITKLPGISEDILLKSKPDWGHMFGIHETIHVGDYQVALQGWEDYEVLPDITHGRLGGLSKDQVSLHYA